MRVFLKTFVVLFALTSTISCKKTEQETQAEIITGNVTYNSLIQSDGSDYFVLDQNKIRLLNLTSPNSLDISSTFPLTDIDFESVQGNKDTLYIQSANGLKIYVLKSDDTVRWEEVASIKGILACDKFDVKYPFLLTSVRNRTCNFSENATTELRLYNIAKLDSVVLKTTVETSEIFKVKQAGTSGFYALSSGGQLSYFSPNGDGANSSRLVLDVPAATDFNIYGSNLLVTSNTKISQYRLISPTDAQLLSTIPVSQ
ncbi:MAG: hypothetical protein ACI9V1_000082 [Spirosomataceae bacterium]|jgi:hypothetical protein